LRIRGVDFGGRRVLAQKARTPQIREGLAKPGCPRLEFAEGRDAAADANRN
jgi:hypothetical protein